MYENLSNMEMPYFTQFRKVPLFPSLESWLYTNIGGHPTRGDNMAMRHRTASLIAIEDRLNDVLDKFCLSDEELLNVEKLVEGDIREQLSQQPKSRDRMLPTYVVKLPDGTEVLARNLTCEKSLKPLD